MAKSDLGTKRVCPDTGRKFYDLGKSPVISPYTGKVVPIIAPVQSRSRPEAARPAPAAEAETLVPETQDAEFVSLEDAEAEQQGKKKPAAAGDVPRTMKSKATTRASTMPPSSKSRKTAIRTSPTSSATGSRRKKSSSRADNQSGFAFLTITDY